MLRLQGRSRTHNVGTIVTDLDRTLTDERLRILPAALLALRRAREAGVKIVLATGRTQRELVRRPKFLANFDGLILESGGVILAPEQVRPGQLVLPSPRVVQRFERMARHLALHGVEYIRGVAAMSIDLADLPVAASFRRAAWFGFHQNVDRVDITLRGTDKGSAFAKWMRRARVQGASVAFGDSLNDLGLFRTVDYPVATGNADPRLVAVAKEVAPGYDGRAVARFIQRRLLAPSGAAGPTRRR